MSTDFTPALNNKQFFRFTGPPEHWLTAVKYMTWGLEEKHREKWKKIQTGDIFFIHSTGAQASAFPNAASGIIGIGVVGFHFSKKTKIDGLFSFLWRRFICLVSCPTLQHGSRQHQLMTHKHYNS